jgi:hypothetical protein
VSRRKGIPGSGVGDAVGAAAGATSVAVAPAVVVSVVPVVAPQALKVVKTRKSCIRIGKKVVGGWIRGRGAGSRRFMVGYFLG